MESTGGSNSTGPLRISCRNRCCGAGKQSLGRGRQFRPQSPVPPPAGRVPAEFRWVEILVDTARSLEKCVPARSVPQTQTAIPKPSRQLRTVQSRPQQRNRHMTVLTRNRSHDLLWPLWFQIGLQFLQQLWKILATLPLVSPQRPHRSEVSARRAAQPQINPSRIQRFQCSKLLRNHQRQLDRQHYSSAADADRFCCRRHMSN